MKSNADKAARRFIKELDRNVNINTIINALYRRGFAVMFYSPEEPHPVIEWLKLTEYSKQDINAFVCLSKEKGNFAFVKKDIPPESQTIALLHELGHIELEHLSKRVKNERLDEAEADTFAYHVLQYANKGGFMSISRPLRLKKRGENIEKRYI